MKWNPWHGCKKYSEGCLNCYVYRIDARHGKDSSLIIKNKDFNLPLRKNRKGGFKVPPGETLYTCFSSDFFLEEADPWRADAWQIIKYRSDVNFFIITKRILRVRALLPANWGEGYPNITIACTAENQKRADERLPEYLDLPIKNKIIICEPLLGPINLKAYLSGGISGVIAGGESGEEARTSNYDWFLALRAHASTVARSQKRAGLFLPFYDVFFLAIFAKLVIVNYAEGGHYLVTPLVIEIITGRT